MTRYSKSEFCEVDGYRCLMPIEYELVKQQSGGATYKKVRCICHNVIEGRCDKSTSCNHFMSAEEFVTE